MNKVTKYLTYNNCKNVLFYLYSKCNPFIVIEINYHFSINNYYLVMAIFSHNHLQVISHIVKYTCCCLTSWLCLCTPNENFYANIHIQVYEILFWLEVKKRQISIENIDASSVEIKYQLQRSKLFIFVTLFKTFIIKTKNYEEWHSWTVSGNYASQIKIQKIIIMHSH